MWTDPIVEEVRAIRRAHTDKFGGDLAAIFEDIRKREQESGREFVTFSPPSRVFPSLPTVPPDSTHPSTAS